MIGGGITGVKAVLEKLDNNEAVLLMYLADELPAEDRSEIERMLSGDESLRKQLAGLRAANDMTVRALRALDAAVDSVGRARLEPGSVAESAAMRRVGRSMRSHLVRQVAQQPATPAAQSGLRFPWWAYPTAATAASVLAFLVWWANNSGDGKLTLPADHSSNTQFVSPDVATAMRHNLTPAWQPEIANQDQIEEREQELAALTDGRDDDAAVWKIGGADAHE